MRHLIAIAMLAAAPTPSAENFRLDSTEKLDLHNVTANVVTYRGHRAVRVIEQSPEGDAMAILKDSDFSDGVIEAELAGLPASGAAEGARGFVGIAFHVQDDVKRYEAFYLRPTNGRADDQLRRNHSTQYIAHPDYPWHRLRKEMPGVYESYVDLVPGEWTKVRIVVSGKKAQLYVNGASQPCLIVNDLKMAGSRGRIALWIGQGTEAHFANVTISNQPAASTR